MTPFTKWVRNAIESWIGTRYEGPQPPKRLEQQVLSFAEFYPKATRAEWVEFATRFAEECYRIGYTRGVEWAERDGEEGTDPEALMDEIDPDWRSSDPVKLTNPDGVPPEERDDGTPNMGDIEDLRAQLRALGPNLRRF